LAHEPASRASRRAGKFGRQAAQTMSDTDWQERLMRLKDRWMAANIDLR
jgi:hypothetical protein